MHGSGRAQLDFLAIDTHSSSDTWITFGIYSVQDRFISRALAEKTIFEKNGHEWWSNLLVILRTRSKLMMTRHPKIQNSW
jgi:hypothetical protein